jgi:hypothetical protein
LEPRSGDKAPGGGYRLVTFFEPTPSENRTETPVTEPRAIGAIRPSPFGTVRPDAAPDNPGFTAWRIGWRGVVGVARGDFNEHDR